MSMNPHEFSSIEDDDKLYQELFSYLKAVLMTNEEIKNAVKASFLAYLEKERNTPITDETLSETTLNQLNKEKNISLDDASDKINDLFEKGSEKLPVAINTLLQIEESEALLKILKDFDEITPSPIEDDKAIRALRNLDSNDFTALKQNVLYFDESWDGIFSDIPNAREHTDKFIQSLTLENEQKSIFSNLNEIISKSQHNFNYFYQFIIERDPALKENLDTFFQSIVEMSSDDQKTQKTQKIIETLYKIPLSMSDIDSLTATDKVDIQTINQIKKYLQRVDEYNAHKAIVGDTSKNEKNYQSLLEKISLKDLSPEKRDEIELKKRFMKINKKNFTSTLFSTSEIKHLKRFERPSQESSIDTTPKTITDVGEKPLEIIVFPDIQEKNYPILNALLKEKLKKLTSIQSFKDDNISEVDIKTWNQEKHQYQWRDTLHQMAFYKKFIDLVNRHCPALNFLIVENHIQKVDRLIRILGYENPENNSPKRPSMS